MQTIGTLSSNWLETLEDQQIVQQALAHLAEVGGDRNRAGWLKWDDVVQKIGLVR